MSDPHSPQARIEFATTQWSQVVRLGGANHDASNAALCWLCERYWLPLYAYVRRYGHDVHDAEDLTQAFFARLLEKDVLLAASPDRGRFRTFLLASMKNFLTNEWDRATAQKRGGGQRIVSLDVASAESRLWTGPSHEQTAERLFERQWVLTLLDHVVAKLAAEFSREGKSPQFEVLKRSITEVPDKLDYDSMSTELGLSHDATRQTVSRLRKRYRELLRAEVAETIDDPTQVDAEIQTLFELF